MVNGPLTGILARRQAFGVQAFAKRKRVRWSKFRRFRPTYSAAYQRTELRLPVRTVAELVEADGVVRTVQLRDLSRNGACVEASRSLGPCGRLRLRIGHLDLSATLRWSRNTRFGLRFDAPIRATDLLLLASRYRG